MDRANSGSYEAIDRIKNWALFQESIVSLVHAENPDASSCATALFAQLQTHEKPFGFPGQPVMNYLAEALSRGYWFKCVALVNNVLALLKSGLYRARRPMQGLTDLEFLCQVNAQLSLESGRTAKSVETKYFEVLVLSGDRDFSRETRTQHYQCESSHDGFFYEFVFVNTATDFFNALAVNYDLQACLIDGEIRDNLVSQNIAGASAQERPQLVALLEQARKIRRQMVCVLLTSNTKTDSLRDGFDRIISKRQPVYDIHYFLINHIRNLYATPFFDALRNYSRTPKVSFHALPLSRSGSLAKSYWTEDFRAFYGDQIFDAETSATQGGLDSLLNPLGPIKQSCQKAARTFGAQSTYFVTSGTSTANKIVIQANLNPGDIILIAADCHKSVPYGVLMTEADVIYLETYPLPEFDLYGAVNLRQILALLQELHDDRQLHRVKQISLTNCTFDGVLYNVEKFMLEILAIKPDMIFHWDEAWFAHGYFNPRYACATAMGVAQQLEQRLASAEYQREYQQLRRNCPEAPWIPGFPDPAKVRLRVYATQSTHKCLSAFRQGAMIHLYDRAPDASRFLEAYRMHTTTSPNYQIIASLDIARRQMSLDGYSLTEQAIQLAQSLRDTIQNSPILSQVFSVLKWQELILCETAAGEATHLSTDAGEFSYDPTRILLDIHKSGMDGALFREILMTRYDIQVNKTSAHTLLFIINIGVTRAQIDYLIQVLTEIAASLQARPSGSTPRRKIHPMPLRRSYADFYVTFKGKNHQAISLRKAYYTGCAQDNAVFETLDETLVQKISRGLRLYSASFVTPYPPGFPVLIPGQLVTESIALYLMHLQIREVHGYAPAQGLKVFRHMHDSGINTSVKNETGQDFNPRTRENEVICDLE